MKKRRKTRVRDSKQKKREGTGTPFLPIPNQVTSITRPPSPSDTALSGLKDATAAELDERSADFYLELCKLHQKADIHPIIALHAIELFTQSLKRSERARLGVPNPER